MIASFFANLFAKRTALQRLGAPTPIVAADAAHDAGAIIDELRAAPEGKRVKAALDAGLPQSALKLGAHAGTVLSFVIDDDLLRLAIGHAALVAWLGHDRDACLARAITNAPQLTSLQLWTLLIELEDATEIYDVFAPVFRARAATNAADARALLAVPFDDATARRVLGDPRIVDLALETIATDVRSSCTLLGLNASQRAVDELRAVLERLPDDDDASPDDTTIAAIDGLHAALPSEAFIDVLASYLASQPKRLVPHSYLSMRIAQFSIALDQHPLVRANASLRWAVAQSAMPPPMPVG